MIKTAKVLKNVLFTETPIYVIFFVTSFCNARCKFCFNWKNTQKAGSERELTLDEIKKIFRSFSSIQHLTLSGGEPFLREDLPEILEFISHNNDVHMITIPTNAILSDRIFKLTRNILNRIRKDTHLRIGLSLEGIGEKHDEIVRVKGAFGKLQQTYHKLHSLLDTYKNFNVDMSLCCSGFNKKDLKELFKYCNDYFKGCTIELLLARGHPREKGAKNVTPEEYREILDYLYRLKGAKKTNKPFARIIDTAQRMVTYQVIEIMKTKKMPTRCYVYSKMIVLQSNGDVFPCEYLDRKLGSLRDYDYDIKKILNDKNNKEVQKFIEDGKCFCTWECALMNNIFCNPRTYPRLLKELIKQSF